MTMFVCIDINPLPFWGEGGSGPCNGGLARHESEIKNEKVETILEQ